jgi:cytochrome c oxidase subunit 4
MATSTEATAAEDAHVEHEHAHPRDMEYVLVALFLALITGAEVGLYYLDIDFVPYAIVLVIAMVIKFSTVAMFFMHLRFDSRVFRWVFVTGILLAVVVYTVVLLTFHVFNGRA